MTSHSNIHALSVIPPTPRQLSSCSPLDLYCYLRSLAGFRIHPLMLPPTPLLHLLSSPFHFPLLRSSCPRLSNMVSTGIYRYSRIFPARSKPTRALIHRTAMLSILVSVPRHVMNHIYVYIWIQCYTVHLPKHVAIV